MRIRHFRPSLDPLEERAVPASDPIFMAHVLQSVSEDFEWMAHPSARPYVQNFFTGLYQDSIAAGGSGVAGMNAQIAQHVGNWLGFNVVPPPIVIPPPPPPPPPVPPKPTDAGMTNTVPDANAPQWVLQQNGLKTWDIVEGKGDPVVAGDSIKIFYTGWLLNGTSFDSKRSPDDPITFQLNNLIEGWKQGIPGMKPGGIRRLYVPSALGYGAAGSGANIPPNSDLIFEIKLISHT